MVTNLHVGRAPAVDAACGCPVGGCLRPTRLSSRASPPPTLSRTMFAPTVGPNVVRESGVRTRRKVVRQPENTGPGTGRHGESWFSDCRTSSPEAGVPSGARLADLLSRPEFGETTDIQVIDILLPLKQVLASDIRNSEAPVPAVNRAGSRSDSLTSTRRSVGP